MPVCRQSLLATLEPTLLGWAIILLVVISLAASVLAFVAAVIHAFAIKARRFTLREFLIFTAFVAIALGIAMAIVRTPLN